MFSFVEGDHFSGWSVLRAEGSHPLPIFFSSEIVSINKCLMHFEEFRIPRNSTIFAFQVLLVGMLMNTKSESKSVCRKAKYTRNTKKFRLPAFYFVYKAWASISCYLVLKLDGFQQIRRINYFQKWWKTFEYMYSAVKETARSFICSIM